MTGLARHLRGELLLPNDHGYDTAIADLLGPRPYPDMYELIPEAPGSVTNITSSFAADELDDAALRYDPTNLFHRNLNIRPA